MHRRLRRVDTERIPLGRAAGRVLAEAIATDRPSPACDVSAMDGYAVRLADLSRTSLPVHGEAEIGYAPPTMPRDAAMRIFTGGPVPGDADAVIPREHVTELPESIIVPENLDVKLGQHIRKRGENGGKGRTAVEAGIEIGPAAAAAMSAFGVPTPLVHRRVRVAAVVTGAEVRAAAARVEPWQLRDSNGPALAALFGARAWIDWLGVRHAPDEPKQLRQAIDAALADADALLLTGGVSMGDHDHVPRVLAEAGCRIVFHRLPVRPGKPVLGAIAARGQAVFGLPGNPVSVLTMARVVSEPILRHLAGLREPLPPAQQVALTNDDGKRLPLWWYRPVRFDSPGKVSLVGSKGSGDVISAARADGYVEVLPHPSPEAPSNFWSWT